MYVVNLRCVVKADRTTNAVKSRTNLLVSRGPDASTQVQSGRKGKAASDEAPALRVRTSKVPHRPSEQTLNVFGPASTSGALAPTYLFLKMLRTGEEAQLRLRTGQVKGPAIFESMRETYLLIREVA